MAIVQNLKKTPAMTTIKHLKGAFVKRIVCMMNDYTEGRVIFDRYLKGSLKEKTRAKRTRSCNVVGIAYQVHDSMSISTMSLKELLSSNETKQGLTQHLAVALLESFHGKQQKLFVVYNNIAKVNIPHTIPNEVREHNHEEADTLIPLHVIDAFKDYTWCEVCVWSPDTDVFVLLIDVAANGHLGVGAQLKFITGKGTNHRTIDIMERVCLLGTCKSQGLLGLHNFSGADWGGKFVGISKRT